MSQELGLRGEQETKTRAILATWSAKRRTVEREDRRLRQALSAEMRPGIAANPDSVNRIVDALMASRGLTFPIVETVQEFRFGALLVRDTLAALRWALQKADPPDWKATVLLSRTGSCTPGVVTARWSAKVTGWKDG